MEALSLPCRNSRSSSTLNATNFLGSTPCRPKIWILAREKPHCGVSGVPFINNTTGAVATALSIAALVSVDSRRAWRVEGSWKAAVRGCTKFAGRESGRNTLEGFSVCSSRSRDYPKYTYRRECCPRKHNLKKLLVNGCLGLKTKSAIQKGLVLICRLQVRH